MVRTRFFFFIVIFLVIGIQSMAQKNRYVVYFSDKNNTSYSVDDPLKFLSQRALDRRTKHEVGVTTKDFPVNKEYISSVKATGVNTFFSSRWFNCLLIEAEPELLPLVEKLPFVTRTELVASGSKLSEAVPYEPKNLDKSLIRKTSLSSEKQNKMLGVDYMHENGFRGEGMLIGVFDGGFLNYNQIPAFEHLIKGNKIIATKNYVANDHQVSRYSDHGTKALSCIAAVQDRQIVGTAPDASFILCITEETATEFRIEEYNWLFAAEFADSAGVDIINTSLGYNKFDDASMNYSYNNMDGKTTVISRASLEAARRGILLVSSAGNNGGDFWKYIAAPADADSILSVGAVDGEFRKAFFSSFGPTFDGRIKPDVAAMGVATIVVDRTGNITTSSGTSFSSPLIAGMVAGYWQANPSLTNVKVIDAIKKSGHMAAAPDNLLGFGVPNYKVVVGASELSIEQPLTKNFLIYPNPTGDGRLFIQILGETDNLIQLQMHDSTGKLVIEKKWENINKDKLLNINVPQIKSGAYLITLRSNNHSEVIKIIKI
jgi:serine protease AprX